MKHNFVSRVMWTQGDSTSGSNTCMIKETPSGVNDHRCGACHNTFDAKVKTGLWNKYGIIKNARLSLFPQGLYLVYLFMAMRRALYILPWVLAVVV